MSMEEFGLSTRTLTEMRAIFANHSKVKKVVIYGSRAMGNYKNGSDIDLTMYGDDLSYHDLSRIAGELDDSSIPYLVDLSIFEHLDHVKLRDHIKRMGQVFYDRYAGWETMKLGDVLERIQNGINCKQDKSGTGQKITRIETIADASINYKKTGFALLSETEKQKARLEVGDILFSHINSPIHVGKTAIYKGEEPIWHGINLLRIKTISEVDAKYFNYFLNSLFWSGYWKRTAKQSVNQASVNQTDIKAIPFSYPPLTEQQRIVAKLDAAFAEIDEAIKLNECKKEYAADAHAAYLEQVFRTSLLKYEQSTLGALCEFHNGKAHEKDISEDGEFYVVNSKFISSDGTVAKYTNKQMFPLITGDIVMVMSDVPNGRALAKAMQINEDGKYSLNQRICCIRSNNYHPQFLQTVLNRHPHFLKFNNGENQTNLRKNDILECPLPVIPLSEQISLLQSIQLLTEETHKLSKIYNTQSRNYDALKSAVLSQEVKSEAA